MYDALAYQMLQNREDWMREVAFACLAFDPTLTRFSACERARQVVDRARVRPDPFHVVYLLDAGPVDATADVYPFKDKKIRLLAGYDFHESAWYVQANTGGTIARERARRTYFRKT